MLMNDCRARLMQETFRSMFEQIHCGFIKRKLLLLKSADGNRRKCIGVSFQVYLVGTLTESHEIFPFDN